MAKRNRIIRVLGSVPTSNDSLTRKLFEKYNGCKMSVKLELERRQMKSVRA